MKKTINKKVGYWYSKHEPHYPMPISNGAWHGKEEFIAAMVELESQLTPIAYRGLSMCRICNQANGNCEYEFKGFSWPSGYMHHIKDHNVKPDGDFKRMVEQQ